MRTAGVAFVLACLVSGLLTPMVRRFALKHGLFDDYLAARKVHGKPIPRLGGVAIVAGFYAPLLALLLEATSVGEIFYSKSRQAMAFLIGGVAISALGLYDDIRGAGAIKKFASQFAVAGALYYFGFRIERVLLPVIGSFDLGPFSVVVTLLWIVGVVNAMNLIDGLDGLAAGVALCGLMTAFVLAAWRSDPIMMLVTGALGGAILGFLVYNFNPASIFMGDTGSMFLGYVLAVVSVQTQQKSTAVAILVPIVALGLPIADTLLAMVRRAINHKPLFSPDRAHIHHKLLDMGLTHKQAVLVLYGTSLLLGATALLLTVATSSQAAFILLAMAAAWALGIRRLGYGRQHAEAEAPLEPGGRIGRLAVACDERVLWHELRSVAEELGMDCLRLSIVCQQQGDAVNIQYVHGDWHNSQPTGMLNVNVGSIALRVEYHSFATVSTLGLEQLRQGLENACGRLFSDRAVLHPRSVHESTPLVR